MRPACASACSAAPSIRRIAAHLGATLLALKRLKLDRVWWLVTPGNPLKDTRGLAPLAERIAAARALTRHPRIDVTGLEAVIKTRYTYDTIRWLVARCPGVRFVWIMGADNLRSFHRWQSWRESPAGADRGRRPAGPEPLRRGQPGRPGARRAAASRIGAAALPTRSHRPGPSCTGSNRRFLDGAARVARGTAEPGARCRD